MTIPVRWLKNYASIALHRHGQEISSRYSLKASMHPMRVLLKSAWKMEKECLFRSAPLILHGPIGKKTCEDAMKYTKCGESGCIRVTTHLILIIPILHGS